VAGRTAHHARRSTPLLGPGDHDGTDAARRVPAAVAPGLIGSILQLLGLDLPVPDHSTLGRRARTLELPVAQGGIGGPVQLLVDSTGLKLCGPGEWLIEKHGTKKRRS
jgi:DDE family transposase